MFNKVTNTKEALVNAFVLAITAPDDEKFIKGANIAEEFARSLSLQEQRVCSVVADMLCTGQSIFFLDSDGKAHIVSIKDMKLIDETEEDSAYTDQLIDGMEYILNCIDMEQISVIAFFE